jgi:GTP pyrophosphokinase
VPLTHTLQTGDRVEILTGREASRARLAAVGPGLSAHLPRPGQGAGLVPQPGAGGKCRCGSQLLEREFRRLALTSVDYKRIAVAVNLKTVDDMYAAVGSGDLSATQVLNAAEALIGDKPQPELRISRGTGARSGAAVQVQGVGNLLTNMAGCCKPVPGDAITGFITQGRGVSIHRADCRRLVQIAEQHPER